VFALLITGCSSGGATSAAGRPSTKKEGDDAVGRYEGYLHAKGNEDVTTACEIGRLATEKAEDDGFGPRDGKWYLTK
jgi:hypothetical protein